MKPRVHRQRPAVALKGRFILGLGSQIKPHITKRFSMEWSHPAPRMREMILAIPAIWDCWNTTTPSSNSGRLHTHHHEHRSSTRSEPFRHRKIFSRGRRRTRRSPRRGLRGFICPASIRRLPARGDDPRPRAGPAPRWERTLDDFEIVGQSFVVTARTTRKLESARPAPGSRPRSTARSPRTGWFSRSTGGVRSKTSSTRCPRGQVVDMGKLIDDEILTTFAVMGPPGRLLPTAPRYGDVIHRISF